MNLHQRNVIDGGNEHYENHRQVLSLESVELLDINKLCGDDNDDSW